MTLSWMLMDDDGRELVSVDDHFARPIDLAAAYDVAARMADSIERALIARVSPAVAAP